MVNSNKLFRFCVCTVVELKRVNTRTVTPFLLAVLVCAAIFHINQQIYCNLEITAATAAAAAAAVAALLKCYEKRIVPLWNTYTYINLYVRAVSCFVV